MTAPPRPTITACGRIERRLELDRGRILAAGVSRAACPAIGLSIHRRIRPLEPLHYSKQTGKSLVSSLAGNWAFDRWDVQRGDSRESMVGPVGGSGARWQPIVIETERLAGADEVIVRFASYDQPRQLELFAERVLPAFR